MLNKVLQTQKSPALTLVRIALGLVILAHGSQKMLGLFGGGGFSTTVHNFGQYMHIPAPVAVLVICTEFFGSLMLISGFFTRVAALGMLGLFIGITCIAHPAFFFMNWAGQVRGEGIEYNILVFGMALALLIGGAGSFSFDRKLSMNKV